MLCLQRASRALDGASPVGDSDYYLHAEIVGGADDALTVGRAAAGIWLTCAAKLDRLPYLAEDIEDDLRDAEWLIGRDQDHLLLRQVTRSARAARGLRPAATEDVEPAQAA